MWSWLAQLLYGPPAIASHALPQAQEVAPSTHRTSQIFDSHIMTEAAAGKGPQAVSLAYDEGRAYGFTTAPQSWMGMTPRERKETLLSIFLANPWASNCIDTIALYITSGGYTIEPRVEKPDQRQRDDIEQLLRRINDDWDFNQYVYDMLTDEMIFGEAFTEFTLAKGKPYQLFSIDCLTMDTEHDAYGRVVEYKQQLSSTSVINHLKPETFVRWWNPHKRAKVDPFSPLERIQDAILLDKKMVNWTTTFFAKGAKFPYYVKGVADQDEADRYIAWFKQNYTGEKNAHIPPVTWGDAELVPLGGNGAIDIDFDKGLDRQQMIVLSALHVPPSIACIAESGNRLTDMSDGQRKILQYIACDPRRNRFFEKFNYRLIAPYFGTDYRVGSRYADFRDDESLAKVADMRIRNGSSLIDEERQAMGREPYTNGGGDVAVIVTTREVTPVPRLKDLEDEQRQTAQVTLDTAKANADLAQTKAKQAKEPPAPLPVALQPGNNGTDGEAASQPGTPSGKEEALSRPQSAEDVLADLEVLIHKARRESSRETLLYLEMLERLQRRQNPPRIDKATLRGTQESSDNTGMMLAFLLDPVTAAQLAIPNGEPAEALHITLAYLGDMQDVVPEGLYTPHTMPESIKRVLFAVTSGATGPLTGKIAGIGRFTSQDDEVTPTPVTASVDIPGLTELRTELVEALIQANYFVADSHGYTPHITLAYIDSEREMPIESVPRLALYFDTVWLCVGDERIPYKLGGDPPTKESQHDGPYPPHTPGAQEAIRTDAEEAADAGRDQEPSALGNNDAQSENIVLVVASTPQDASRSTPLLSSENSHHASETIEEHNAQPATHPQSNATDDAIPEKQDEDTRNGALYQAQEARAGDSGSDARSSSGSTSDPDRDKVELTAWIISLLLDMKQRGSLALPTAMAVLSVYTVTDQERASLARKLAEANLAAGTFAYRRDRTAVGLADQHYATGTTLSDLLSWSHAQVESITTTFHSQLATFAGTLPPDLPPNTVVSEVDPWIDRYTAWKAPQIANATVGTGMDAGSMAAIDDMIDADSDPSIDFSTDNVRIRVVPAESSSDYCSNYAGKDYTVSEYLAIGITWPAHPGCPHSIEAYLDDSNDLAGGDA